MQRIPLRGRDGNVRAHALVDDGDFETVSAFRWHLMGGGYAARTGPRPRRPLIYMHRFIMDAPTGIEVDHENRNRLDNQRFNLRFATRPQNGQNIDRGEHTSRYRGVYWASRERKWNAGVWLRGRRHHAGYFSDENEAGKAVAALRARLMPFSQDAVLLAR